MLDTSRIVSSLRWLGLFSSTKAPAQNATLLDTLCAQLEQRTTYHRGERDLVMLHQEVVVEWTDGTIEVRTAKLEVYGAVEGHSARARLEGVPCGVAAQLLLDGVLAAPGVYAPYDGKICSLLRKALEEEGIGMVERVL